jgi:hypothetical protein
VFSASRHVGFQVTKYLVATVGGFAVGSATCFGALARQGRRDEG